MATQAELDAAALAASNALAASSADAADATRRSAVSVLDAAGDFTATDVEGALAELQTDHEGRRGGAGRAPRGRHGRPCRVGGVVRRRHRHVRHGQSRLPWTSCASGRTANTADAVMDGDAAGGVLSGTYPIPGFAADMATQAESGRAHRGCQRTRTTLLRDLVRADGVDRGHGRAGRGRAEVAAEAGGSGARTTPLPRGDGEPRTDVRDRGRHDAWRRLGGTWASPTVDTVHSGSSHAATQAAAEATAAAAALLAHTSDASDAHDASAISIADAGGDFTATDVEGALDELQADAEADAAALATHLADTTDAHLGTAIGNTPAGNIAATTVQAAINELDTEKAAAASAVMDGDAAGGVLSGTYPRRVRRSDMATQAELDAHTTDAADAHHDDSRSRSRLPARSARPTCRPRSRRSQRRRAAAVLRPGPTTS